MATKIKEAGTDHCGGELPDGISASIRVDDGTTVGYRVRWREEDEYGVSRQPSKSFSGRKAGSLDLALEEAVAFQVAALEAVQSDGIVTRTEAAQRLTSNDVFQEWVVLRGPEVSEEYAKDAVRLWEKEIEDRPIGRTRLERMSADPAVLTYFQDELASEGMKATKRRSVLKLYRTVMRWGRRRHPKALTVELSGLFELPRQNRSRLAYAADAIGLERIIEAILKRPTRDDLRPLRDAALAAAMGFTIATRPSEWRRSATWGDLYAAPPNGNGLGSIVLQRANDSDPELIEGLKTGAHVALVLPNAWDRIQTYREALEDRFGPQPAAGLIFQVIGDDGPVWITPEDGGKKAPLAWSKSTYQLWVARVWNPARDIAAQAPDAPDGLNQMVFYDSRHTAISMALHSTLVIGPHGMNLHPLGGWAGHDIETLQRYYRHFIARYMGAPPIDLVDECEQARIAVEQNPFAPEEERVSPQREFHQRRRRRES